MTGQMLITGGAGFIGSNATAFFGARGWKIAVLDNLSRPGGKANLEWLRNQCAFDFILGDIRDADCVEKLVRQTRPNVILHLAGQVAVTTSVENPREDFEINALGALNMLEAVRLGSPDSFFINASTNKVYGRMEDVGVRRRSDRYEFAELPLGVSETRHLDFHSPYGCSKGAADQYSLDYARIYGLRTTTFRQSCIYGPRQFGVEDQGWVAWFTIAAELGHPITIYGDGRQVRDILHVDDLLLAYEHAIEHHEAATGEAFNIGGGPENTLSLLELLKYLDPHGGKRLKVSYSGWRPGDQPIFVCDVRKASQQLRWRPAIGVADGVRRLKGWVRDHRSLFGEQVCV